MRSGKSQKTWSTPVNFSRREEKLPVPCALCGGDSFKPALSCEGFSFVKCKHCGLVQMNPQPLEPEIFHRYENGEDYLKYELENEENFLRLARLALEDAGFYRLERVLLSGSRARVLDVGCAVGSLLADLKSRGWDVAGVEINRLQAQYARQNKGLDVKTMPLEKIGFPDGYFNAVLASHVIEHLNNPASFISELKRILVPGGHVYITTPNIGGFQALLFKSRWRSAIFDHLYLFSRKTLTKLLVKKGFIIESITTWGGLGAGTAPKAVKNLMDKTAKYLNFGDVMVICALTKTWTK